MIASCHDVFCEGHHEIDCALCFLVFGPHPFFCACSRFFFYIALMQRVCLHTKKNQESVFFGGTLHVYELESNLLLCMYCQRKSLHFVLTYRTVLFYPECWEHPGQAFIGQSPPQTWPLCSACARARRHCSVITNKSPESQKESLWP